MASLYIAEYERIAEDARGFPVLVPVEPAVTTQKVTFSTSAASAAFNDRTKFVRVMADANGHYVVGADPTATATGTRIIANQEYFFGVPQGKGLKIAAYDGTS